MAIKESGAKTSPKRRHHHTLGCLSRPRPVQAGGVVSMYRYHKRVGDKTTGQLNGEALGSDGPEDELG